MTVYDTIYARTEEKRHLSFLPRSLLSLTPSRIANKAATTGTDAPGVLLMGKKKLDHECPASSHPIVSP